MTPDSFQQPAPQFVANQKQSVKVGRGGMFMSLILNVTSQPAILAAANTQAAVQRGDDLGVLGHFRLFGNDGLPIIDMDGPDLFWYSWLGSWGNPIRANATLGDAATLNPTVQSVFEIPMISTRVLKPFDTALDSTNYTDMTAEFTFKDHLAISSGATGFTTAPAIELYTTEVPPHDHPYLRKRIIKLTQTFSGAGTQRFNLDQGPEYRRFIINTTTGAPATDTTACFSRLRLISGGRVKFNQSEAVVRDIPKNRYGLRFNDTARRNLFEKQDAWYLVDTVLSDGLITEALDTQQIASNYLEFDITQACTINVLVELLEDIRRPQYGGLVAAA